MVVERTVMCDHSMQMILLMERNKGGGGNSAYVKVEEGRNMHSDRVAHVYDSVFKKILTLSVRSVAGLSNWFFGTDYPSDSSIS